MASSRASSTYTKFGGRSNLFATSCATRGVYSVGQAVLPGLVGAGRAVARSVCLSLLVARHDAQVPFGGSQPFVPTAAFPLI
jgi:hypothetical protein